MYLKYSNFLVTNSNGTFMEAIKLSPLSILTALINVISIWSILGLSGFHTYLLAINQTTNEDVSWINKAGLYLW